MINAVNKIAIYVTGSPSAPAAVEAAGKVAESFGASVLGFHAVDHLSPIAMAPMPGAAMNPVLIDDLEHQSQERAAIAEDQFLSVMKAHGWEGRWHRIDEPNLPLRDTVARVMQLADLVVAEQGDIVNARLNWLSRLEESIVDSGRPVIVHPHGWSGTIGETRALIAWKPTREAARAVHDALPFLARMEKVTITAIDSRDAPAPREEEPGKMLADFLATHGVAAESQPLHNIDSGEVGDVLMGQAAKVGADLLVLGAFSHSRLREGLFGGVTRDVIKKTAIPALLSH